MADIGEKLRGAGVRVTEEPRRDDKGRGGGHGGSSRSGIDGGGNPFPRGYPEHFTEKGYTRVELLQGEAERIAERFAGDKLTRNQLRAFYDHAKRQQQRLQYGASFGEVHPEIARLKLFAADRARRSNPIPQSFKDFIDRNIDAVVDQKSFEKGFMPHFEAVVGYCARLRD